MSGEAGPYESFKEAEAAVSMKRVGRNGPSWALLTPSFVKLAWR